jgi:EAL and modified HD-GYP domain-containing signal transduction protein
MVKPMIIADEACDVEKKQRRNIFVARQPIYNQNLEVLAYDLLFRYSETNEAGGIEAYQASAQVLLNTFVEIGLDKLVGNNRAFIRFSRGFLLLDYVKLFPSDRIGIEVKDIVVGNDLLEVVGALSVRGYTIILDDFIYHDDLLPLVELADIVKLDMSKMNRTELAEQVVLLKPLSVQLLAKKIETRDDFDYCNNLGFDYFQGFFFCQPEVVQGRRMPANRLAMLQLISALQNPAVDYDEIEILISKDVALSYRLLNLINSAYYARTQKIDSIRQCLLLLGMKAIKTTVSLLLLSNIDDKPHELLTTAMIRAKMSEQIAIEMGYREAQKFFLVGLFSVLDALLDRSMRELLQNLPLQEDIHKALLGQEGILGTIKSCVLAYERGKWNEIKALGLDDVLVIEAYLNAISWANDMNALL